MRTRVQVCLILHLTTWQPRALSEFHHHHLTNLLSIFQHRAKIINPTIPNYNLVCLIIVVKSYLEIVTKIKKKTSKNLWQEDSSVKKTQALVKPASLHLLKHSSESPWVKRLNKINQIIYLEVQVTNHSLWPLFHNQSLKIEMSFLEHLLNNLTNRKTHR